jgi:hypothetical protein
MRDLNKSDANLLGKSDANPNFVIESDYNKPGFNSAFVILGLLSF